MTDSAPGARPPTPFAHSLRAHARAVLLLLLLLVLTVGFAYPLAIGGLGVAVHRDVVHTSNNSTGSGSVHPGSFSGGTREAPLANGVDGGVPGPAPLLDRGEPTIPLPPTLLYSPAPAGEGAGPIAASLHSTLLADSHGTTGGT